MYLSSITNINQDIPTTFKQRIFPLMLQPASVKMFLLALSQELIMDFGTDVNYKGYDGRTPLALAAYGGHFEVKR